MVDKQTVIGALQIIVTNLSQQADGHDIQAKVFESKGYSKLAKVYADHAAEERGFTMKMVERVLDIGGFLTNGAKIETPILDDPVECLKYDLATSVQGLAELDRVLPIVHDDVTTYEILKDYYMDEEQDMYWTETQLALINEIGLQNWLVAQLRSSNSTGALRGASPYSNNIKIGGRGPGVSGRTRNPPIPSGPGQSPAR